MEDPIIRASYIRFLGLYHRLVFRYYCRAHGYVRTLRLPVTVHPKILDQLTQEYGNNLVCPKCEKEKK
jgi:hypothetical protein